MSASLHLARALVVACAATPCLWDSDTLDTELRGLPEAHDLLVGRWHRHGDAYYQARVDRILAQPERSLADYDDLAVAYEHLGQRDDAIAVMGEKAGALAERDDADQRYRYHANLGTFHAHAGRFDEALGQLRAAVALNPDAHFGRERYQIELIEYVAAARNDAELWRTSSFLRHAGYRWMSGATITAFGADAGPDGERDLDWDEAYQAVGGMLRFGGLEGPELYRTLGELFLAKDHLNLAWWAFGRAIERGHPAADLLETARARIRDHWREAEVRFEVPDDVVYREARASADRWLAAFQQAEANAVASGLDVSSDQALERLIASADAREPREAASGDGGPAPQPPWIWIAVGSVAAAALALWASARLRR